LIITDDCSTDNTLDILNKYANADSRIYVFQLTKNSGAGVASNNSIRNARGDYIAFCDSDDIWLPNKLKIQIDFIKKNNLNFTYSTFQKINEKGEFGGIIKAPYEITYKQLLKSCPIGCLTVIYNSNKLGKIYMPEIRKRQDYGLWLMIFKIIDHTKGIDEVLAYYRTRKGSISSNKLVAARYHFKVLRQVGNVPFIKAVYYFMFYAVEGVNKYFR
jgi:glycosyltransferase involved in cell wall biosynthesis